MDQEQMRQRCPDAKLLGVAALHGYRLAFTIYSPNRECGCADIVASAGNVVWGLMYELTDNDAQAMDVFEGCPENYRRISATVHKDGTDIDVFTYEVVNKQEGHKPSSHYAGLISNAAREFNFPEEYQKYIEELSAQ
jgi:hypothetical protein